MRAHRSQKRTGFIETISKDALLLKFGSGYQPRAIHMGGQVYIGHRDGRHDAFGEYGHRLGQMGYEDRKRFAVESEAEFAAMQGPAWRGTSVNSAMTSLTWTVKSHGRLLEKAKKQREAARKDHR